MDPDHPRAENAEAVEVADGRGPVLAQRALALVAALRDVNVKSRGLALGQLEPGADHRRRCAVWAVRRRLDHDGRVTAMRGDQLARAPRGICGRLPVALGSARPVVHRARQDEPDPDRPRGLDHGFGVVVALVLEVEEVDARGGAVPEHLGERERGAERDPAAVEPLGERVEHPLTPAGEVEVVAQPAQERLERVAMGVDGTGQERLAVERDVVGLGTPDRLERGDPALRERHRPARHEAASGQDQVGDESQGHSGASQTVSSWLLRKWLGVIVQPRSRALCGTMRCHWKVKM